MKKSVKRKLAGAMAVATLLSGGVNAFAALPQEEVVMPMYVGITAATCSLTLGSYGKLTCEGATQTSNSYYAGVTVELQRNDGGWTTIKTWSVTDGSYAAVYEDYFVLSGYSYRLKVTHKSYTKNWVEVESVTAYSNTVNYN